MDERVLITGGCGGIGSALAAEYARRGAGVAVSDLPSARLPEPLDGLVLRLEGDAGDPRDVAATVDRAERELGPLTTVIANAGVPGGMGLDAGDDVWELSWRVNVMAHVHLARTVVPRMLARGGGRFAAVASAAGLLTNLGNPAYSVTKHGAVAFAEWLAITYGDQGLDVRLIAPMGIETDMLRSGDGTLSGAQVRVLGVIAPDEAARRIVDGMESDRFLILTHPEVAKFEQARALDRDGWLAGMRKAQRAILDRLPEG
jgi:NAD(P)-dependent dehydrogenase (short-subunit alcohol dehydrogenase family)